MTSTPITVPIVGILVVLALDPQNVNRNADLPYAATSSEATFFTLDKADVLDRLATTSLGALMPAVERGDQGYSFDEMDQVFAHLDSRVTQLAGALGVTVAGFKYDTNRSWWTTVMTWPVAEKE